MFRGRYCTDGSNFQKVSYYSSSLSNHEIIVHSKQGGPQYVPTTSNVCKLPLELHSWLGCLPPRLNLCSVSRTLQRAFLFHLPTFSHVTPIFYDLHWLPVEASDSRQWYCQQNCPCLGLPPSASQTTHPSSSIQLNYLSWILGTVIAQRSLF